MAQKFITKIRISFIPGQQVGSGVIWYGMSKYVYLCVQAWIVCLYVFEHYEGVAVMVVMVVVIVVVVVVIEVVVIVVLVWCYHILTD